MILSAGAMPAAFGELEELRVGGAIQIYGSWYSGIFDANGTNAYPGISPLRPLGPDGTLTYVRTDGGGRHLLTFEQRTRLHADARFSGGVSSFVEIESIHQFGAEESDSEVALYQAFFEMWPRDSDVLRLRIGRQELALGSGWLVGANPVPDPFSGLSFDGLRLSYILDHVELDAWATVLDARSLAPEDDIYFGGVLATWRHRDEFSLTAYWMFLWDRFSPEDNQGTQFLPAVERVLGVNDYASTRLHTIGAQISGERGAFAWDLETAAQFGSADAAGHLFQTPLREAFYGDDDARWNSAAARASLTYTIDAAWQPAIQVSGAYYGGQDKRRLGLGAWLNPARRSRASLSFNRLFSDFESDYFLDESNLSNHWSLQASLYATPSEAVQVGIDLLYAEAVAPFDVPLFRGAPGMLTRKGGAEIGWQAACWAEYDLTSDIKVTCWYAHLFPGDALRDGVYAASNGLSLLGGKGGREGADTVFLMLEIAFGGG